MKKLLLLLTMLVVVGISSYADDYTITFKSTANGATEIKPTTKGSTFVESTSTQYLGTTAVAAASKVYYGGQTTDDKNALRFNTTSAKGTITFNLSDVAQVNATSVILSCKLYGTSDTATKVKVNGNESTTEISNTSDYEDIEVSLGGSKLTTLTIENSNSGKYRFYLKSIKVVSGNGGDTPDPVIVTPPTITINGEKQGNDYLVGATATISAETEMIQYTLDGTTPTVDNGELYTEPIVLDKAQKYTIKAIALDDDFNASEVKTLEVNVVEKTVTPPAGDSGTVVYYADGFTLPNKYDIEVKLSGSDLTSSTWTATNVSDLKFYANSSSNKPQINSSVCRWYTKDKIEITPAAGIVITGLKMVTGTSNSVCANNAARLSNINNTAWTAVSNTEATWSGKLTDKFEFSNTHTAQIRFQYLEVTYEKVQTGPVVDKPVITITGEKSGEDYLIGATASISAPNASYIFYTTDGSDPKAEGNTAVKEVEATSVDLGKLALGETTIKAYIWDAEANASAVETVTVNVVKKPAGISWSSDQCKIYLDEEPYEFPTLNNPNELKISYSIPGADAAIATIDKETGEITIVGKGSTTVRATYTSTDDSEFAGSWVSYNLIVTERPAGESVHATSYMFDFTDEADFRGLASYGMTFFTNGLENNKYETDMENPVTTIIRKGVTLDFVLPDNYSSGMKSYRLYQGSLKKGDALRVYNAKLQFSVPAPGRIKSIVFHKGGSNNWNLTAVSENNGTNPTGWDGDVATWTSAEDESISTIWFDFSKDSPNHTRFTGITVEYDLGKPATPYVVSETADAIVVECDDWCELHYTKKPESAAKAPSRAQLNDGTIEDTDEWYNHGSYQITIDKNNTVHQDRGYSFIANHADTGLKSDALNLYVGSDGTLTGVEGISAEADADAPVEFYDLQGRMVANPQGGIFIRRQGSKVTKVAL